MKKLICAGLAAICFIQSTSIYADADILKGDIDNDGSINIADATSILSSYALNAVGLDPGLTDAQKQAADVDADGKITISDATYVLSYYARNASGLNVDWESIIKGSDITTTTTTTANTIATTEETTTVEQVQPHHIYITKTGKKYHYDNSCNGGTYYEVTLDEALARGLTPCNKCVKD